MSKAFILHFPLVETMLINSTEDLQHLCGVAIHLFLEEMSFEDSVEHLKTEMRAIVDIPDDEEFLNGACSEIIAWAVTGFTNAVTVEMLSTMRNELQEILSRNGGDVKVEVEAVDVRSISILLE